MTTTLTTRREAGYPEALSKHKSGHPHPTDTAVFLCLQHGQTLYGGTTAGEYDTFGEYPAAVSFVTESESRRPSQNMAASLETQKEPHMANIISADFNGTPVTFRNDAYLNASAIAAHFGKRAQHYLDSDRL